MRLKTLLVAVIAVLAAMVAYTEAVAYLAQGVPSIDVPGAVIEVPYYPMYGFHTKDALRKLKAAYDPLEVSTIASSLIERASREAWYPIVNVSCTEASPGSLVFVKIHASQPTKIAVVSSNGAVCFIAFEALLPLLKLGVPFVGVYEGVGRVEALALPGSYVAGVISNGKACFTVYRIVELRSSLGVALWAVYSFVKTEIKYLPVTPATVEKPIVTIKRGYGDCGDIAAVEASMLEALGFDAALAAADTNGDMVPDHALCLVRLPKGFNIYEAPQPWITVINGERWLVLDPLYDKPQYVILGYVNVGR